MNKLTKAQKKQRLSELYRVSKSAKVNKKFVKWFASVKLDNTPYGVLIRVV